MESITTCIILNYNDAETTISLINLIKDYKALNYILIVDNASTDNSSKKIKEYTNDKIILIETDKNGGYGYGNNVGIKYAYQQLKSEFIVISNPDIEVENSTIIKLKEVLISNKSVAIAAPVPYTPSGKPQEIIAWRLPSVKQEILEASVFYNRVFGMKKIYNPEYFSKKVYSKVEVVQGSFFMAKTSIIVEVGLYDEEFFLYEEEQILGYKLKENGYISVLLNNESYVHKHSVTITKEYKSLLKKKQLFLKSKILFLKKYLKIKGTKLFFAKCFYHLTLIEILIIALLKKLKI